jgi:quinol monooxygenase YgiN
LTEPGTFYEAYQEEDSPAFVHLMCFESEDAEDAHRKSAHTGKFVSTLYPICEQEPVFTDLSLFRSSEL